MMVRAGLLLCLLAAVLCPASGAAARAGSRAAAKARARSRVGLKARARAYARFRVSPVSKVVQMLNDMNVKAKLEKQAEQVSFSTYKGFCENTAHARIHNIKKAKEQVEDLKATIQEAEATVRELTEDMAGLAADLTAWGDKKKEAESNRQGARADFESTNQDYAESLRAIGEAKRTVEAGANDQPQAPVFMQLESRLRVRMPERARRNIMSFLERGRREAMEDGASEEIATQIEVHGQQFASQGEELSSQSEEASPEADAYEAHSSGMTDMIDRLNDKFKEERDVLQKEEANAKHSHDLMMQDLTNQIQSATEERSAKAGERANQESLLGEAKGELADTSQTLAADEKFLADLRTECQAKSTDFENSQKLRAGEIKAIEKAVEILTSDDVRGASEQHLPSFSQEGTMLLQMGSTSRSMMSSRMRQPARLQNFFQARAKSLDSNILSLLADRVGREGFAMSTRYQGQDDPFTKVKRMIKDLIVKLMDEANEESEHKGWCDAELGTNAQTRDQKSDEVTGLKALVEELTADIAKLSEELSMTNVEIAAIDESVAEATNIRVAEKEKNTATITDAKQAQTAVATALNVLKDFYGQASEAASFAQEESGVSDGALFTGQQDAGGVLGMLQVIESDFARLESETLAAESEAQGVFDKFSADSAQDKAVKGASARHQESGRQQRASKLAGARKDLRGTSEELQAAMDYYAKLTPSCVDAGTGYEDRVARRKEEIESLQEGLQILSGNDIPR